MNDAFSASHLHIKHVVHAYDSDNGYPSSRDDGDVLPGKATEHQQQQQKLYY